jgi:hypothetical protein
VCGVLPDAGLAREDHRLPVAFHHLLPAIQQQPQLLFPSHQRGQPDRCFEATATAARLQHPVDLDRVRHALEARRAKVLRDEEPRHKPQGGVADHHSVRLGHALQAGRDVGGVAEGEGFAAVPTPHLADHDRTGMDSDTHGELHPALVLEAFIHAPERQRDLVPGPDRALGVVLVGLRVAEVDQQPVAQVLGHVPLVAVHHCGGCLLVAAHHLAPVLGIHPGGYARRVHQVAEEHRELAAFGLRNLGDRPHLGLRCGRAGSSGADPRQDLALERGHLLDIHQLLDELVQGLRVQPELALQRAEGDTAVLPEEALRARNGLEEAHGWRLRPAPVWPRGNPESTRSGWGGGADGGWITLLSSALCSSRSALRRGAAQEPWGRPAHVLAAIFIE